MVDKVALGQDFLRVLWFCPVSAIPPMLHIHQVLTRKIEGNLPKTKLFRKLEEHFIENYCISPPNGQFLDIPLLHSMSNMSTRIRDSFYQVLDKSYMGLHKTLKPLTFT
jgi:hypothetical protein